MNLTKFHAAFACLFLLFSSPLSLRALTGGPDAFGYVFIDSNEPNGPAFVWQDITTLSGAVQVAGLSDDNSVGPFALNGWSFYYYGNLASSWKLGSNGWIGFDNIGNISWCFPTIPTAGGPADNYLAPFMSDLTFNSSFPAFPNVAEVWYWDNGTDSLVVQFNDVPWWSSDTLGWVGSNTFQVILSGVDNSITFMYKDMDQTNFNDTGGCASEIVVGIENDNGTTGLEVYNEVVPPDSYAIRFEIPCFVSGQVPVADFGHSASGLNVAFLDSSLNSPTSWFWDFGDGSTSTQQNTNHSYANSGVYTVCLIVSNPCGSDTICKAVSLFPVFPNQGVSFYQVDYTFKQDTTLNSGTGQVDIDISAFQAATGYSTGYLNVTTPLGWAVQNLPVFPGYPYPSISTNFMLDSLVGFDIDTMAAHVQFTSSPVLVPPVGGFLSYSVGDLNFNAEGVDTSISIVPGPPKTSLPGTVSFIAGGLLEVHLQPGHKNVECADNQCLPMAVSNSFQWLEDTYGIMFADPHVMGLGLDGSMVGEVETEMMRVFVDRRNGHPTQVLKGLLGKLSYIGKNDIMFLNVKHMGWYGEKDTCVRVIKVDTVTNMIDTIKVTSRALGDTVTAAAIIKEIREGEDVELGFAYKTGGGHAVEVVGAGTIFGIPWVMHMSDYDQSDDTKGTDRIDFSFLKDTDADGLLNINYNKADANVVCFFSQSPDSAALAVLSPIENSMDIALFPNPNSGEFHLRNLSELSIENAELTVLDNSGKINYQQEGVSLDRGESMRLELPHMAAGLYFLVLRSQNGFWKKEFLVQED